MCNDIAAKEEGEVSNRGDVDMYTVLMKERLKLLRMQTVENIIALQQQVKLQNQVLDLHRKQLFDSLCSGTRNFLANPALPNQPLLPLTHIFAPAADGLENVGSKSSGYSYVQPSASSIHESLVSSCNNGHDFIESSKINIPSSSSISVASTEYDTDSITTSHKRKRVDHSDSSVSLSDGNHKLKLKVCKVPGCFTQDKGGGFCAKHGGGKPCASPGCSKRVAGTKFCSEHGGNRKKRCSHEGCEKGDQGGGFCAAHGGGRRCCFAGCERRSVGKDLCWAHGGGKRCKAVDCKKSPKANGFCCFHQQ